MLSTTDSRASRNRTHIPHSAVPARKQIVFTDLGVQLSNLFHSSRLDQCNTIVEVATQTLRLAQYQAVPIRKKKHGDDP